MLFCILIFTIFLSWISVTRYKKLFNPFTLSIQYPLFFITLPQVILIVLGDGEDSFLSDGVILLYILAIYWGTSLKIKVPSFKIFSFNNYRLIIIFTFFLLVLFSLPLIPYLLSFGLSLRGLREFYEYIVFSPYASFYEITKTLLLFLILILFVKNKKCTKTILILTLFLIFSGSKMAILSTTVILATAWEEYKLMNYKYLSFLFISIFILLIFYHYYQSINLSVNQTVLNNALSYFDVYRQQTLALDMFIKGKIDYFYGEISLSSWYKVIPRFIWENKPKAFGFALLNYKIYPEFSANGYMPSFGLASIFADFGFFSIVFTGFFTGFFKNYIYKLFYKSSKNIVAFLLYILDINIVFVFLFFIYYSISSLSKKNDS